MSEPVVGYIGLGSNLGDRAQTIKAAIRALGELEGTEVLGISSLVETQPLHPRGGDAYLNAVVQIRTRLSPLELLDRLMQIESQLGRVRTARWGPRTIDLDLLLLGDHVVNAEALVLPHPQMHLRSFVLQGLLELDRGLVHPVLGQPLEVLAARLNGKDYFVDPHSPKLVCMAGLIGVGKTSWARAIASRLGGQVLLEPYDSNPFLAELYAGRGELALDCQLYFLVHRAGQLAKDRLGSGKIYVADYVFQQEQIYADMLLDPRQLALYRQIHQRFSDMPARCMLVIWLHARPKVCLDRIIKRGRPYESCITLGWLDSLARRYEGLFRDWTVCPVIRLDTEQSDVNSDRDVMDLARQVEWYISPPGGLEG